MIKVIPLSDELRKAMIAKIEKIQVVNPRLIEIIREAKEIIEVGKASPDEESPFPDMYKKIRFYPCQTRFSREGVLILSPDGPEGPSIHMQVSCDDQQWDWSKLQIKTIMFVF